jgi:hypothetical protein
MATSPHAPDPSRPTADRFALIEDLLDVRLAMLRIERDCGDDEDAAFERVAHQMGRVWRLGQAWARFEPLGTVPRVPALIADLTRYTDELGQCMGAVFQDGCQAADQQACVFPTARPRNAQPATVWAENAHFWVVPCARGLTVVSKNVAGGTGDLILTPRVAARVFSLVARNHPVSATYWFNADPYGMDAPTQTLLRDDRVAGWDQEYDDDGMAYTDASDTLGELFLKVEHPGDGELFFGVVEQEHEQVAAFQALQVDVERLFAQARTPERQAAAEARARVIRGQAALCFLSPSGYCECCEADVTPLLIDRPAGGRITGCPACMRTWCD